MELVERKGKPAVGGSAIARLKGRGIIIGETEDEFVYEPRYKDKIRTIVMNELEKQGLTQQNIENWLRGEISAKPLSFILLLRFRGLGIESDFCFTYDYPSGTIPVEMVPDVVRKLEEKRLVFVSGYSSSRKDGIYRAYNHYFFRRWPFDVRQMLKKLLQEYVNKSLAAICGKTLKSSEQLKEAIVTLFWEKYNHLDEEARRSIKKFLGWIENAIPIVRPYSSVVDIEFWEWEELSRLVEVLRHKDDFETTRPILEQIGLLEKIKFVDRSSNQQEDTYVVFPYIGELKNRIFSVFVGTKPVMNYVLAVITQFNEGASEVCIKARGKAISRAVDTAEVVRQRFLPNVVVKNISIGTETLQTEDGRKVNVSTIEIILAKEK